MTSAMTERHQLAVLGWLATVATSLSLYPALQEKRFLLIAAGFSAVVVAVGVLWRHLHLPSALAPLVQLLITVELILLTYGEHLRYGFVPTPSAFSTIDHRISTGTDMAQRFAAPVPHSPGLTMMTVAFIVVVAIAVDALAAGALRAPLAGLPLLTLYSVPVASLPGGVPVLGFIPGAAAYVALLMVAERERLGHWGRHVATAPVREASGSIDTSALSSTGRRISVAAIAAAVIVPVLVPGFSHQLFHGRGGLGNGDGTGIGFTNPMVSLANGLRQKDPVDLVDVTSSSTPSYLRLAVLNQPGPNAWRSTGVSLSSTIPVTSFFPAPAGQSSSVATRRRSLDVTLTEAFPRDSAWLPVPYEMSVLNLDLQDGGLPDDFAYVTGDETVTAATKEAVTRVASYSVEYREALPTVDQLVHATPAPPQIAAAYGRVPAGVPSIVAQDARDVTAHATSDYEAALDLQSFFRDGSQFTYDLNAGYGYGYRAMARFLQARRGYCQHFAATMAMMARVVGIPSRVVVGFLAPGRRASDGTYVFTSHDAHAWPELYFGGVGWVRFEPTPGNGASIPPYTHNVAVPSIDPTPAQQSSNGIIGHQTNDVATTSAPAAPEHRVAHAATGGGVPPLTWLVVLLVFALLFAPAAVRLGVRRARLARAVDGGASSEYAWRELRDRIVDLRLPWTGSLTPRARQRFVEPLLGGDPDAVAALDRLSLTVERARYAATPLAGASPARDAQEVMRAITQAADRGRRLRAFLWPSSLMPEVRGGWSRLRSRFHHPDHPPVSAR